MLACASGEVDAGFQPEYCDVERAGSIKDRKRHTGAIVGPAMKIVHVETGRHLYGGAQQVLWLARGLAGAGTENVLVCPPGSDLARAAAAAGLDVRELACAGDHDVGFALRLRRNLKAWRPDVVHCHSRRGGDIMGGIAARLAGIPALLSRRVDNPESAFAAQLRYRWFRRIVAISDNVAAVLHAQGIEQQRVELIRSAVDVEQFAEPVDRDLLQSEFGIAGEHFAIAVVSQLIHRKGHRFLLDVLPGLLDLYPDIRVVFFGQGPEEERLRALAAKLGIAPTVCFAGFRSDLKRYLGGFDVLVHPATQEGLGVAMLEAASAGIPVIAFDAAGAAEAVAHAKTGILVPPNDLMMLQRAIAALVEEPEMRLEFGIAGRARMRDEFDIGTMVERHLELYERILDDRT